MTSPSAAATGVDETLLEDDEIINTPPMSPSNFAEPPQRRHIQRYEMFSTRNGRLPLRKEGGPLHNYFTTHEASPISLGLPAPPSSTSLKHTGAVVDLAPDIAHTGVKRQADAMLEEECVTLWSTYNEHFGDQIGEGARRLLTMTMEASGKKLHGRTMPLILLVVAHILPDDKQRLLLASMLEAESMTSYARLVRKSILITDSEIRLLRLEAD